jgi:hypothetical protein
MLVFNGDMPEAPIVYKRLRVHETGTSPLFAGALCIQA